MPHLLLSGQFMGPLVVWPLLYSSWNIGLKGEDCAEYPGTRFIHGTCSAMS